MPRVLREDLEALAAALIGLAPGAARFLARQILARAERADRFARHHRRPHPRWGDGSVAAAAAGAGGGTRVDHDDPEALAALSYAAAALAEWSRGG